MKGWSRDMTRTKTNIYLGNSKHHDVFFKNTLFSILIFLAWLPTCDLVCLVVKQCLSSLFKRSPHALLPLLIGLHVKPEPWLGKKKKVPLVGHSGQIIKFPCTTLQQKLSYSQRIAS